MSISDADIAFVKDLFASVGTLTTRKMFGGLAIYADGVIFALIDQHRRFDASRQRARLQKSSPQRDRSNSSTRVRAPRVPPCPIGPCPALQWMSPSWPAIGLYALCCKILDKSLPRGRISDAPKNRAGNWKMNGTQASLSEIQAIAEAAAGYSQLGHLMPAGPFTTQSGQPAWPIGHRRAELPPCPVRCLHR